MEFQIVKMNVCVNSLIALGLSLSASAFAADGMISFEGIVNGKTCTLDSGSQNLTVTLPSVLTTTFSAAGTASSAAPTQFTLTASGCDVGTVSAAAVFSAGANVDSVTGNLKNTFAGGTNAQVRLYKKDGLTPINLANFGDSVTNTGTVDSGTGTVSVIFFANYFGAVAPVTPGLLKTSIQYSMQYL
ncbi:hypothetical protein BMI79_13770 [Serratia oryzae]|uniref:Fimbrial-type adhesion domain-containing protein n=2 Tax=Serratia oryzae TaxID=2034155 RepID=A0A1S8CHH3_9GAMM|nr:hypothetical protein BMI79_13770 [Serratia oryzae]